MKTLPPLTSEQVRRRASAKTVAHDPVLREPRLPRRGRRILAPSPAASQDPMLRPVHQPDSVPGVGQFPTITEGAVPNLMRSSEIQQLVDFFRLLDTWEKGSEPCRNLSFVEE
jgi:hypothetical protein